VLAISILCLTTPAVHGAVSVRDDQGATVTLPQAARRIVTLAPHATELVFAAGAGARIVGTVEYSDYPVAAKAIPRVGDTLQLDMERLVALKPDLVVAWRYHPADRQLVQLRQLGIPLFYSDPQRMDDLADSLERLGRLAGTEPQARREAAALRRQTAALAARYRGRAPVRVFYQVWDKPLYTLNGKHIVNDAIRLCGGDNIFAALPTTAPEVTVEAVLLARPDVIISGDRPAAPAAGLALWRPMHGVPVVRRGKLFSIDGDLLNRAGPRMVQGMARLCETIDQARENRRRQP
jgi:iron complex transport system substrate-binding protein